jgi:hypothetical protein
MKSGMNNIAARIKMHASTGHRRAGLVGLIVLASILLCGATVRHSTHDGQQAPNHTGAQFAGFTIQPGSSEGTLVLVQLHRGNHTKSDRTHASAPSRPITRQ